MNMRYTLADPGTNPAHEGGGGEEGRLCDQAILPRARAGSRHLSDKWGHGPYTALLAASCHARARRGLCIWEGWHRLRGEGTEKIHLSRPSVGAKAVTLLGLSAGILP
jgi:hypothetical protein